MKFLTFFLLVSTLTLIHASPSKNSLNQCREPDDYRKCEVRCKYRGFEGFSCDELTGCQCYQVPDEVLMENQENFEEIQHEILNEFQKENFDEIVEEFSNFPDEKQKVQCNPQLDGDLRCYNYCKTLGMRNGKCLVDGQCDCYNLKVSPNFDRENPDEKLQRKCYPGLENADLTCYRYCKMFGLKYGKCEGNGQCRCYDDELSPY